MYFNTFQFGQSFLPHTMSMHSNLHYGTFLKVSLKLCKYLPSLLNKVHLQSDTILGLRKWFYLFMHVVHCVQPSSPPPHSLFYVFLCLIAQDPDSYPCENFASNFAWNSPKLLSAAQYSVCSILNMGYISENARELFLEHKCELYTIHKI